MKRGLTMLALLAALGLGGPGCGSNSAGGNNNSNVNNNRPQVQRLNVELCSDEIKQDVEMIGACASGDASADFVPGDWMVYTQDATVNLDTEFTGYPGPDLVLNLSDLVVDGDDYIATVDASLIDTMYGDTLAASKLDMEGGVSYDATNFSSDSHGYRPGFASVTAVDHEVFGGEAVPCESYVLDTEGDIWTEESENDQCVKVDVYIRDGMCVDLEFKHPGDAE